MAQKFLGKIQQFSTNDLVEFLRKNGYEEFQEVLLNEGIDDGKKFLELNELQLIRFRLPPAKNKKLYTFLKQIKENPQKFAQHAETKKPVTTTLNNRGTSFRSAPNPIIGKLEQVFAAPPTVRKPTPAPKPPEKPPDPQNEYLPMGIESRNDPVEDHYDDNGYLLPTEARFEAETEEENNYEPPPSSIVPRGRTTFRPLPLPRDSTDEQGYIHSGALTSGRSPPPPLFPHLDNSRRGRHPIISRPKNKIPSPPPSPSVIYTAVDDEEVDYEPIDDREDFDSKSTSSDKTTISDGLSAGSDTGTISRFIGGLFRKGKKSEALSPNNVQNTFTGSSISLDRAETKRNASLTRSPQWSQRPLPALPIRQSIPRPQEDQHNNLGTHNYENVKQAKSINTTQNNRLGITNETTKSKSENDLSQTDENASVMYGNLPEPKHPGSYEKYIPGPLQKSTKTLPLPPSTIPKVHIPFNHTINQVNLNNEPFFRNTDRKGARLLLLELKDGAFLFRPSKQFYLALSLKHNSKYFNLGIVKTNDHKYRLHTESEDISPEFLSLEEFVDYFTMEFLMWPHKGQIMQCKLCPVLTPNIF